MDYATTHSSGAAALQAGTARIDRPLESLPAAVQRVNTATVRVQNFLDRFHGEGPTDVAGGPVAPEQPYPHGVNLQRLLEALDRLESRVEALNQIG